MNFQTAAIVGAASGLLSFLAGLIGGVPVLDAVFRAILWGGIGFGGCLGIEAVLRSLIPDLFLPSADSPSEESVPERVVDIVLDEEPVSLGGVIEEVDDDQELPRMRPRAMETPQETPVSLGEAPAEPIPDEGEEMPEIGSFLDAFKPGSAEEAEQTGESSYGEFAPVEQERRSSQEVTMDGEEQDPVILAKAVQTIMKRDA